MSARAISFLTFTVPSVRDRVVDTLGIKDVVMQWLDPATHHLEMMAVVPGHDGCYKVDGDGQVQEVT